MSTLHAPEVESGITGPTVELCIQTNVEKAKASFFRFYIACRKLLNFGERSGQVSAF